ncbi:CLUMA_CG013415, isoform A [Clunio marinus]|uniref:CLUMA_CG013415, isoform A n=1 Tax=Clunio marinus TaxID=568069 RepID=A0A1J1IK54_9DIPT|nr:CLUMA_CG013415, isoform A [Clunio marinus]
MKQLKERGSSQKVISLDELKYDEDGIDSNYPRLSHFVRTLRVIIVAVWLIRCCQIVGHNI